MSTVSNVIKESLVHGKYYNVYVTQVNTYGLESEKSVASLIRVGDVTPPDVPMISLDTSYGTNGFLKSNGYVNIKVQWGADTTDDDLAGYYLYTMTEFSGWNGNGTYDLPSGLMINKTYTLSNTVNSYVLTNNPNHKYVYIGIAAYDYSKNVSRVAFIRVLSEDNSSPDNPLTAPTVVGGVWQEFVTVDCINSTEIEKILIYRDDPSVDIPGEPCDGVVLHRTNVEIGLIHTYAHWSGCGFRTRDICRLTKGGVVISESNRSQVFIDDGAYGSARFDVRYLGTVHPNWTGVLPTYVQPMPEFDGVTINASKRFQCDITVRRIQQPSPRVHGVTAVVLNNSASIKVTCSSTVAGWSGDPEYQEYLSGDAILYTGDGGTIDADVTECNGHALNIQGSTANINFSVTFNKSGGAALYRNSLGNSRFGNIITGTIHRCKLGFESVGTPAIEQINLSMIMTGSDEVVFVGDPPSFNRDSLWRINAAISDDGLATVSTQKSFTFNLVPNTTTAQTVTIPHGYLYEPNPRQVIFSLEDRATPTTAELEYLYLNDITETDLVFAYKYKTTDMSPAANTRVNVFISQSGGGVGDSVLTNTNTGVDDSGNIIDYLNIFNQSLI